MVAVVQVIVAQAYERVGAPAEARTVYREARNAGYTPRLNGNGLVTAETDRTIAIQTATEALTLDKQSIKGRKITEQSPMPEGLLDNLSDEQIRNLIAYLSHPTQVDLP